MIEEGQSADQEEEREKQSAEQPLTDPAKGEGFAMMIAKDSKWTFHMHEQNQREGRQRHSTDQRRTGSTKRVAVVSCAVCFGNS